MKASANYSDAIGADLGVDGSGTPVDPTTIKPMLTTSGYAGRGAHPRETTGGDLGA